MGFSRQECWSGLPFSSPGNLSDSGIEPASPEAPSLRETLYGASQVALVVKNLPAKAGNIRDMGLITGSGRSPGGGHGNTPQYSQQATVQVHRVTKSQTH